MKDRKEHLRSSAQYNYDRTYFEENFISYELLCRGYVRDIDTILRLRIDNDVIFPTKDNSGNMDEYRIDHSKHIGKFIRCGALSPKYNYDRIYKDFYEYKFMTKIKKIKDVYGRNVIGCFQERRKIVHSEQDLYGTYECITEPTSDKIKSSTFIILPGKQTYSNSTLKRPLNDKLFYSCNLYDEKYFHIYEMHVKFPNKEPIIYTLFGRENLDFKIIENHYIRYTPNPKTIESENAEVTCYYNLNGTDGSIIKYHYEHH
uniref:6-cysteine protein n=1 Tax=Parastrongyloides trichosuri TaxID=131310 RepID=A0A0N4ZE59_PARTI